MDSKAGSVWVRRADGIDPDGKIFEERMQIVNSKVVDNIFFGNRDIFVILIADISNGTEKLNVIGSGFKTFVILTDSRRFNGKFCSIIESKEKSSQRESHLSSNS